ncbi:hypothetical protein C8J57DRAFT_1727354 [Mycena rebaudengoi]|nr:hypothetical protein C8J57DRAFT_1727354 [Mycena rebaudengoi]
MKIHISRSDEVHEGSEQAHRVACNAGRQSTRARNTRESHELSDATKELQAKIADELEKRRESSAVTMDVKEQLASLKRRRGRVKSTPLRGGRRDTQSNVVQLPPNTEAPSQHLLSTQSNTPIPAADTALAEQPQESVVPNFNSIQPVIDSFDIFGVIDQFNWDVLLGNGAALTNIPPGEFQNNFPQFEMEPSLGRAPDFNTLVPSVTPPLDPLQDFIGLFGTSGPSNHTPLLSLLSNDDSLYPSPSGEGQSALNETVLQPSTAAVIFDFESPSPESSVASPVMDNSFNDCSVAVGRSRAKRVPEVDVNLILPDTSSRSKAPSSRMRAGEEPVSRLTAKKQQTSR